MAIVIYLQRDVVRAVERYIHLRETVGLSRDEAMQGAIMETRQAVEGVTALAEDGIIIEDEQVMLNLASKRIANRLNGKSVSQ